MRPTHHPHHLKRKSKPLGSLIVHTCLGAGMLAQAGAFAAEIEEILVIDRQQEGYLSDSVSLGKFTESLRDTPQSVTTLTQAMLEDRGAMNLDDALRNVPGITLGAGEFSWQGNNPSIRGFSSRNDMFLDGMRDIGYYTRDPFYLESIEVLQGPSSMVFGRGSTGGVINQSSKKPGLDPLRSLHVNAGNAGVHRVAVDVNQPLGNSSAFRVNALAHEGAVPGREHAEHERYGLAPSLSLGLGSATQLTLSYLKLDSDAVPDYGMPWIEGKPARVPRGNFYGFDDDYLETEADIGNVILTHQINGVFSVNAQLRVADYSRSSRISEPQVAPSVSRNDPPESVTVSRMIFSGQSEESMLQGQINLRADFSTGSIDHVLVSGLESAEEKSAPAFGFAGVTPYFDYDLPTPDTNLANPSGTFTGSTARRLQADTNSGTLAAYLLDTVKFNEQWQWIGGIRWDRFDTDYIERRYDETGLETSSTQYITSDIATSYRTAVVYKPVEEGTLYLGWGTSFNPSSEAVSFISSGRGLGTSNAFLDPEENESLELGVKWELMNARLMVDGALFRIRKTNARVPDPVTPGFNILAGSQQIEGLSVNLTGRLTDTMQVNAGYTYLDDEQVNGVTGSTSEMMNVAENTLSLWLDWAAIESVDIGAGVRYVDERSAGGGKTADDYWVMDAMVRYQATDNMSFKLNLTNLTDEYYFDQLHPWHVIPGPGFASVFAVNFDY